uniref:Uncharacterized protein n=1 Tax=Oryza meridionalis TaxID=40149 RepID=A0A0E0DRP5_9ORYZ
MGRRATAGGRGVGRRHCLYGIPGRNNVEGASQLDLDKEAYLSSRLVERRLGVSPLRRPEGNSKQPQSRQSGSWQRKRMQRRPASPIDSSSIVGKSLLHDSMRWQQLERHQTLLDQCNGPAAGSEGARPLPFLPSPSLSQGNYNSNNVAALYAGNEYGFDTSYYANRTVLESDATLHSPRYCRSSSSSRATRRSSRAASPTPCSDGQPPRRLPRQGLRQLQTG